MSQGVRFLQFESRISHPAVLTRSLAGALSINALFVCCFILNRSFWGRFCPKRRHHRQRLRGKGRSVDVQGYEHHYHGVSWSGDHHTAVMSLSLSCACRMYHACTGIHQLCAMCMPQVRPHVRSWPHIDADDLDCQMHQQEAQAHI